MVFLYNRTKSLAKSYFIVLSIQLFKEGLDSFALTATWEEAISDTSITMIYPTIVVLIVLLKKRLV